MSQKRGSDTLFVPVTMALKYREIIVSGDLPCEFPDKVVLWARAKIVKRDQGIGLAVQQCLQEASDPEPPVHHEEVGLVAPFDLPYLAMVV